MSLVTGSSRFLFSLLLSSIFALTPHTAHCIKPPATLGDLKKLEIICYIPSWLPKGFKLRSVSITHDEPGPDENKNRRLPLYSIEYGNGPTSPPAKSGRWADLTGGATFTIECAREGIGDRNVMESEDSEEVTITSPFGPMYLIFTPKGQGGGQKVEIKANWVSDVNIKREKEKDPHAHPVLGRYHGFSATAITVAEFEKIIQSLRPIRP